MRLFARQFQPSLGMTLLYLLVGSVMLGLATWQMQRAAEKISMLDAAALAAQQAPVSPTQVDLKLASERYSRVLIAGQFQPEKQFLWDNRIVQGRAGFEVISPLRLADNQLILINRGWVPLQGGRDTLPEIAFQASAVRFTGVMSRPSIGFSSGDAVNLSQQDWPRLLQHFDFEQISEALNEAVLPVLVQIVRDDINPRALAEVPLFEDNWRPVAFGPERHYGYAAQWFAMFLALTALFFILNSKSTAKDIPHDTAN